MDTLKVNQESNETLLYNLTTWNNLNLKYVEKLDIENRNVNSIKQQ